jgi:hypothetical protein
VTVDFNEVDPLHELHGHMDQGLRVALAGALQWAWMRNHGKAAATDKAATEALRAQRTNRAVGEAMWSRAMRAEWWEQATPDQIARVFAAALAHAGEDPGAADALVRIDKELDARHGLTIDKDTGQVTVTSGEAIDPAALDRAAKEQGAKVTAGEELSSRWREALGPDLADSVMTAKGWDSLEARLVDIEGKGQDSAAALHRAVHARSLEGARDPARVIGFRLSTSAESAADKGAGVEAEGVEVARLINDSMANNRHAHKGGKAPTPGTEPWQAKGRTKGRERGPSGPDAAPER